MLGPARGRILPEAEAGAPPSPYAGGMSDDETPATAHSAWVRPRPTDLRGDFALAVLLAFGALTTALLYLRTGIFDEYPDPWVWVVALGLSTLPLALRRKYPAPVAVAVAIGFFITGQFGVPELLIVNISLFLSLYTVGAWESNRVLAFWSRFGITAGIIVWLIVSLIVSSSDTSAYPGLSRSGLFSAFATFAVIQIVTNLIYFAGAFYFGERSWRSARAQSILEAQGRELEFERSTSAAQAVALDRIAIARELHDVVAHHVSVMGIQAAAARRIIDRDPAASVQSLELIEESARVTVDELRRLVHTLREPNTEGVASTVGIAQIPTLIDYSQNAGVPTTLIVAGEVRPLPMLIDVALYRIVQEALSNVRKHAGRGAEATVRLRFASNDVEVEISDNGVRQSLESKHELPGLGLRGMRERIGAVGGSVFAGRRETGGFMVRATVPNAYPTPHEGVPA